MRRRRAKYLLCSGVALLVAALGSAVIWKRGIDEASAGRALCSSDFRGLWSALVEWASEDYREFERVLIGRRTPATSVVLATLLARHDPHLVEYFSGRLEMVDYWGTPYNVGVERTTKRDPRYPERRFYAVRLWSSGPNRRNEEGKGDDEVYPDGQGEIIGGP